MATDPDTAAAYVSAARRVQAEAYATKQLDAARDLDAPLKSAEALVADAYLAGYAAAQESATILVHHEVERLKAALHSWSGIPWIR